MNWYVFFKVAIGTPILVLMVMGWVYLCNSMSPKVGDKAAMAIMLAGVLLTVATVAGLAGN